MMGLYSPIAVAAVILDSTLRCAAVASMVVLCAVLAIVLAVVWTASSAVVAVMAAGRWLTSPGSAARRARRERSR